MKVVSYNLWGKFGPYHERWADAPAALCAIGADVWCLQEAGAGEYLEKVAKATQTRIVIEDLDSTGLAVLAKEKPLSSVLVEYKTHSPLEPYIRKFECVDFGGKRPFRAVNTHLSWKPGDDASRRGQAEELRAFLAKDPKPTILCGDFNGEYAGAPMQVLRKDYRDLMKGQADEGMPSWDNANPFIQSHKEKFPDRRIDLILANDLFLKDRPLASASIIRCKGPSGRPISDHYGILAEFLG